MLRLIVRSRNLVEKISYEVLELCCFEWFQNRTHKHKGTFCVLELCCFEWFQNWLKPLIYKGFCFRAVLFRMVPKLVLFDTNLERCFRAVLFRMVPKLHCKPMLCGSSFRAVLFRMVPKQNGW